MCYHSRQYIYAYIPCHLLLYITGFCFCNRFPLLKKNSSVLGPCGQSQSSRRSVYGRQLSAEPRYILTVQYHICPAS